MWPHELFQKNLFDKDVGDWFDKEAGSGSGDGPSGPTIKICFDYDNNVVR